MSRVSLSKEWVLGQEAILRFPVEPAKSLFGLSRESPRELATKAWTNSRFRQAILLASPHLYHRARDERGEFHDEDLAKSICRYLVRSASRSTPFGMFSGVSCVSTHGQDEIKIPDSRERRDNILPNSDFVEWLSEELFKKHRELVRLCVNDTLSEDCGGYSFYCQRRDGSGRKQYRMTEVEADDLLLAVIEFSGSGRYFEELCDFIEGLECADSAGRQEVESYVLDLIDSQVLCADLLHDVTSSEPILAMAGVVAEGWIKSSIIDIHRCFELADSVESCGERVSIILSQMDLGECPFTICKVTVFDTRPTCGRVEEGVAERVRRILPSLLTKRNYRSPLALFVKNFEVRFGDTAAPLSEVLKVLKFLGFSNSRPSPVLAIRGQRKSQLEDISPIREIIGCDRKWAYVEGKIDCAGAASELGAAVPLVAWLSLWSPGEELSSGNEQTFVEVKSVGRQEPGRIMGRFASGLPALSEKLDARTLRGASGPDDVIFAEIVYKPAANSLNVISRCQLSGWEVRIRAGARNRSQGQLGIEDLRVSVRNGKVLLHDQGSGKEVRVRMSNAHVFTGQGNLPVYAFLNAVSNQDAQVRLETPRDIFPEAEILPGVVLDNFILARPTWLPGEGLRKRIRRMSMREAVFVLREEAMGMKLPAWLSFAEGDNVLPLSLESDWMAEEAVRLLRGHRRVLISDVFPFGMVPAIKSLDERYFHELQVVLRSGSCEVARGEGFSMPVAFSSNAVISPASVEWVCFNIYSSPDAQNDILIRLENIGDFEFFFVRYSDALGDHIRLRIRGEGVGCRASLNVMRELELMREGGKVGTYSIVPYYRELQRYGGDDAISFVESIFCLDSKIFLRRLLTPGAAASTGEGAILVAASFDAYLHMLGLECVADKFEFARRAAAEFSFEFSFGTEENRRIGRIYRDCRSIFELSWPSAVAVARAKLAPVASLWSEIERVAVASVDMYSLRWSLIHMHANRVFQVEGRRQEAVIWELLKRWYVSQIEQGVVGGLESGKR